MPIKNAKFLDRMCAFPTTQTPSVLFLREKMEGCVFLISSSRRGIFYPLLTLTHFKKALDIIRKKLPIPLFSI